MAHLLLVVIIEKELMDDAIEALKDGGAVAFTYFEAGGEGVRQLLDRWVDPQKAVILTVIAAEQETQMLTSLQDQANLSTPGVGIAFTLPVSKSLGIGIPLDAQNG